MVWSRAHPRRCGEHIDRCPFANAFVGSSPQVRGTSNRLFHTPAHHGLIPAGAGNISRIAVSRWCPRAHPRRCGEHGIDTSSDLGAAGSSPQVRGTSGRGFARPHKIGLIPAGAGNINPCFRFQVLAGGSSPQVRGTCRYYVR